MPAQCVAAGCSNSPSSEIQILQKSRTKKEVDYSSSTQLMQRVSYVEQINTEYVFFR